MAIGRRIPTGYTLPTGFFVVATPQNDQKIMKKKTIRDIPSLKGKTVLVTVDFNISLSNGIIANDTRIREALPTISYLVKSGAKVLLASHLGRPKGRVEPSLSLRPVSLQLEKLIGKPVRLIESFWEPDAKKRIDQFGPDEVIMLENIRFHLGDEANDRKFSKHLASFADYFVNDAFGASHRVHASTVGVAEYLPSYAGLLLAKEIAMLSESLEQPKRPLVVFIGGAKTPEKINVISRILDIADTVALGGAVANTFLAAWGYGTGQSLVDHEMVEMARVVFWKATRKHAALLLPSDVVVADRERKEIPRTSPYTDVSNQDAIFDIGPETILHYQSHVAAAKTIIWNGPMGLYEDKRFKKGTDALLKSISTSGVTSIIGGGDTLTSIHSPESLRGITHVSTGGSAMLEFMEKGTLPGIEVLLDA